MPIHASSLDFDGCLYTERTRPFSMSDFVGNNRSLLSSITRSYEEAEKIILVGSLRQTTKIDALNGSNKWSGSCYLAMEHISRHLNIKFDRLTVSDIYLWQAPGYSVEAFFRAVAKLALQDNGILTSAQFDQLMTDKEFLQKNGHEDLIDVNEVDSKVMLSTDKVNIIYAQMHKLASQKPTDEIVFDFYDDLHSILDTLKNFFTRFPGLIPSNVTLRLFHYASGIYPIQEIHAGIKGIGNVDLAYYQTVINMGEIAKENDPFNSDGSFTFAEYITPERLEAKTKAQKELGPNALTVTTLTSEQSRAMAMASAINDFAENNPKVRVKVCKWQKRFFDALLSFNLLSTGGTPSRYDDKGNTGEKLTKRKARAIFEAIEGEGRISLDFSLEGFYDTASEGYWALKAEDRELMEINQNGAYAGAIQDLFSALEKLYPAKMAPADVMPAVMAVEGLEVVAQIAAEATPSVITAAVQTLGLFRPAPTAPIVETTDEPHASTLG